MRFLVPFMASLLLFGCSTLPGSSGAEKSMLGGTEDFRKAVVEYVEITGTRQRIADLMLAAFRNVPQYNITPGSKNEKVIMDAMDESFSELVDLYAEAWSGVMTLEEMKEIVDLMKSKPGQTLLRFQTSVVSTSGPLMAKYSVILQRHLEGKL